MWFDPKLIDTDALQKIIRANRTRVEIMDSRKIDEVDFCFNDILSLFSYRQVKADRGQLRKVVQDCWKLKPASNSFCYTTYTVGMFRDEESYVETRRCGRYYTVTRQMLENL